MSPSPPCKHPGTFWSESRSKHLRPTAQCASMSQSPRHFPSGPFVWALPPECTNLLSPVEWVRSCRKGGGWYILLLLRQNLPKLFLYLLSGVISELWPSAMFYLYQTNDILHMWPNGAIVFLWRIGVFLESYILVPITISRCLFILVQYSAI